MKSLTRITIPLVLAAAPCLSAGAAEPLLDSLRSGEIAGVRVDLNPWGPQIGFQAEYEGGDPRLAPLLSVLREATPGRGHKCANAGAIRFRMADGSVVGIGLLPGHEPGLYEIRLYDGRRFVGVVRIDRDALLSALEGLGLPMEDPAIRE